MASIVNADNGVISGAAGLKLSSDTTGILNLQTNGTTAISVSASQVVSFPATTTLDFSGTVTLSGGTANGVTYLNGSKALTSGSALTFSGSSSYPTFKVVGTQEPSLYLEFGIGYAQWYNSYGNIGLNAYLSGEGKSLSSQVIYFAGYNNTADAYLQFFDGKMRIAGNGNVGIGTASPASRLHVDSSATNTAITVESDLDGGSLFTSGLNLLRSGVAAGSRIQSLRDAGAGGVGLNFLTTADNAAEVAGTLTSRMVIDRSGNLGIGTSSPGYRLDVQNTAATTWARIGYATVNSGAGVIFNGASTQKNWVIANQYNVNGGLEFTQTTAGGGSTIGSTPAMVLDSSGNLGLGVTPSTWSVGKALEISTAGMGVWAYSSRAALTANYKYDGGDKFAGTGYAAFLSVANDGVFRWYQSTASGTNGNTATMTQAMTLDASGNLALGGTTNKITGLSGGGNGLTIQGATAPTLALYDTTNAGYYLNLGQIEADSYLWNIANGFLSFGTNNTERARITSDGNFVVGTTSSSRRLQASFSSSTAYSSSSMETTSLLARFVNPDGTVGNYAGIHFAAANNSDAAIAGVRTADAEMAIAFGTRGSGSGNIIERARITSSGEFLIGKTSSGGKGLEIYQASDAALRIQNSTTGTGSNDGLLIEVGGANALIFNYENGFLRFGTNNSERVRIAADGKVGINTSSPDNAQLVVKGASAYTANTYFAARLQANSYSDTGGYTTMLGFGVEPAVWSKAAIGFTRTGSYDTGYLGFYVNSSADVSMVALADEKARIDSSGNLLVGTTSSYTSYGLIQIRGDNKGLAIQDSTDNSYRAIYNQSGTLYFYNGSNEGYLSSAGAWVNASDVRLKRDVVSIKHGLDSVMKSQPRSYKMKDSDAEYVGFIAQEMLDVIPECVSGNLDKQYGISYGPLVAVAFKAIQEQQAMIKSLEAKVAALEAK